MGSVVVALGLSCSMACGIFLQPGIELVSPTLVVRFLFTEPPGKSRRYLLIYTILQDDCLKPWAYNLVTDILFYIMPVYDIKNFQLRKILVMFYFI